MRWALALLLLCWQVPLAWADIVVVANPQSGIERLSKEELVNIYLGRYRRLPTGQSAEPIDIQGDADIKARFYRSLVDKSLAEINAYWARLVFSGKTRPPVSLPNVEEALQFVARYPKALAYVDRSKVDKRVSVVFEMGD